MSFFTRGAIREGTSFKELKKMVLPSILFHLTFFVLLITVQNFHSKKISYPETYMVRIISDTEKRPLEIKSPWIAKETGKIERVKRSVKPEVIKRIAKGNSILEKKTIKKKSFPKKISKQSTKRKESNREINEAISRIKGEVKSEKERMKGALSTGAEGEVFASADASLRDKIYYTMIWSKIKENWILPDGLIGSGDGLEAILSFTIRRQGDIENIRFEKSSGNIYFDKSVLRAIEKSSPLPSLHDKYKREYLDVGVRFRQGETDL
ncbi:MAG: TonB family protein [Thermodesulfobacteriota bacterium]|nr:TonB family protein [Thermodesulfobacteriota bacterium]